MTSHPSGGGEAGEEKEGDEEDGDHDVGGEGGEPVEFTWAEELES